MAAMTAAPTATPTAVGIIPARFAASRFPGKPLTPIDGLPMVQRVWQGASESKRLSESWVATDDERIADACREFGARVCMTRADHPTGTDRLAEAAETLEAEIVVNIQGDEPLIEGWVVDAAVDALVGSPDIPMSTVIHPAEVDALDDPNRVKVVLDRDGCALYFSRAAIPHHRDADAPRQQIWQHVGLYAYRRAFLREFVALEPSPLERSEQLEQLRALENGHRIRCAAVDGWQSQPVDVPGDVALVEALLRARAR
jgi:3-deoxy-manno-octulosonate cytidylyltransferase (CMP-KDO synthetase)